MNIFEFFSPFLFFLLFGVLGLYLTVNRTKKMLKTLEQTAKSLGLRFVEKTLDGYVSPFEDGPRSSAQTSGSFFEKIKPLLSMLYKDWFMEGELSAGKVKIFYETRGSGKSRQTYTIIDFFPNNPLKFPMEIQTQGFFSTIGIKLFKMEDIIVGDEEFDKRFRILGQDVSSVKEYLKDPQRRKAIMELFNTEEYILKNDLIRYERSGAFTEVEYFKSHMDQMNAAASRIYENGNFGSIF